MTDKQQDLNQYLVYEGGCSASEVQNMTPKEKIEKYLNLSHINCNADTIIYLAESAFEIDLS